MGALSLLPSVVIFLALLNQQAHSRGSKNLYPSKISSFCSSILRLLYDLMRPQRNSLTSLYITLFSVDRASSWMICGTNKCEGCDVWQLSDVPSKCSTADWAWRKGLDRDKDKSDLRRCPEGFHGSDADDFKDRYLHFPQLWPAADVYLRKCRRCVLEDVLAGRIELPNLTKIYC